MTLPLLWLLGALGFAQPAPSPLAGAEVHLLDNGLPVLVSSLPHTDQTVLMLKVRVGSGDESTDAWGAAHLLEHLMFEGSANVPGDAFDRWLTEAGGDNNAWTTQDETVYHMRFPSGAMERALFLEADRFAHLDGGLTEDNLANQKDVVLQERAEALDGQGGHDLDVLLGLIFPPGHPYHHPILGSQDSVRGLSLPALRTFWRTHYRTRNATLVLVGPQPTSHLAARARAWFGPIVDTGEAPVRAATSTPLTPPNLAHGALADRISGARVYLGWSTVPLGHADEPALELLTYLLDDGPGTPMADQVERKRGLEQGAVLATHGDRGGYLWATLSSPRPRGRPLARQILRLIRSLHLTAPDARALDEARAAWSADYLRGWDQPATHAEALLRCYELFGQPDCRDDALARVQRVTPEDVQRVARTYLTPDRAAQLTVHPRRRRPPRDATPVEVP